ncbi:DUF6891 domain-containing protein [Actinophytocola sp.]|uniref:DUF6891 domain-containing protein n=1 Tax=Actinophytocola sp. TaxID=1872138 RepID=UPI002ED15D4F
MLDAEEIEEIEEYVRPIVHGGFSDWDEVAEAATEAFVEEEELPEDDVMAVVDRLWRARLAEQAGWPAETEAERVLAALDSLSARGIVSRVDFTCCNSCGLAEIAGHAHNGEHGYVFFHEQDTEAATQGEGLYLSYGTFDGADATTVGQEVVTALKEAGAPTVWDGTTGQRILVHPLEWRIRIS